MTSGWSWFQGPGNRVIAVHWPADVATEGAWQLRPLGQALPERLLAVPFQDSAGEERPGEAGESPAWHLTREQDRRILVSPQHVRFLELVPATRKRLLSSRLVQGGVAMGLLLGGLAWLTPSGIQAWRDRPDRLYEQSVDGEIILSASAPKGYRATWDPRGVTWTRATPAPSSAPARPTGRRGSPAPERPHASKATRP